MAEKTVRVKVTSTGLKETTAEAQKLNKELDKVEKARKASTTGSRAADAALLSTGTQISTGLGRGTAASMGRGDSRDFARQAQGLGGLVHVYATFAANVFAVAAAFTALSRAMDFELMVKSSEIMSTRVGASLANVAKDIYTLTDAAVSLKDAFAAGNLAANAGLTTNQIQGLAKAAKGASLAMGRDMNDSLNRIFRGTVKIEPELLDELGIMVKVNDVNREYAKNIGKSVTALTDFERRQAFVNGVLEQAEEKYGELANTQANVFSQLQASVLNLITTVGMGINTVLGPFVSMLASSPTALLLLMGSLVGLLVKQAIPAIKDMGAATLANLEQEKKVYEEQKKIRQANIASLEKEAMAKVAALAKEQSSPLEKAANSIGGKLGESIRALANTSVAAMGPAVDSLKKKLDSTFKATETKLKSLVDLRQKLVDDPSTAQKYGRQTFANVDEIDRAIDKTKQYQMELGKVIDSSAKLGAAATGVHTQVSATSEYIKLQDAVKKSEQATIKFQNSSHIANAILASESGGMLEGWRALRGEIRKGEEGTGRFLGKLKLLEGGFQLATAGMARFISTFGIWGMGLSLAITGIAFILQKVGILDGKLTKSKESMQAYSNSVKSLADNAEKLDVALKVSTKFDLMTANIKLQIEALDNLKIAIENVQKLQDGNWFQKSWEWIKKDLPGINSQVEELGEQLTKQITSSGLEKQLNVAVKANIDVPKLLKEGGIKGDTSGITDVLQAIEIAAKTGNLKLLQAVYQEFNNLNGENLKKVSAALQGIKESTKLISDNSKEYITGISKANKEFDSANNALNQTISLLDTLSSSSIDEFGTALMSLIESSTDAANIAYTQTSKGYEELLRLSTEVQQKQEELKGITDPKIKAEKSKELQSLINTNALNGFELFIKRTEEAAKNLYELGKQASILKVQTAAVERTQRLKDFYDGFIKAPKGSEDLLRQDKLIEIGTSQIRIQLRMLEVMQQQEADAAKTDPGYLIEQAKFDDRKTGENFEQYLNRELKELVSLANNRSEKGLGIPPEISQPLQTAASALATIKKIEQSKLANEATRFSYEAELKAANMGKSTGSQRDLADANRLNELGKIYNDAQNSLKKYTRTQEILNKYTMHTALGLNTFSKTLLELSNSYIDAKADASLNVKSLQGERDLAKKSIDAKLLDVGKEYTVNEQASDIVMLQALDMRLAEAEARLKNVESDRLAKEFNIRLQEYKGAEAALQAINVDVVAALTEQVEFDLANYLDVNKALKSTENLVTVISHQMNDMQTGLLRELRLRELNLKNIKSEEERLTEINAIAQARLKYQQDITKAISNYIEKYKLLRELNMKKAEEPEKGVSYIDSVFNAKNMANMGEVFITSIRNGLENLRPWTAQLAESFAEVINSTIDLTLDLFQTAELTWESFIDGTRNLLSDMFKDLASNQFKKAIGMLFESGTKKLFANYGIGIESDQEKEAKLRNTYLNNNTTALNENILQIHMLTVEMQNLTANLNGRLWNNPLLKEDKPKAEEVIKVETFADSRAEKPIGRELNEPAQTFGIDPSVPLAFKQLGEQTEFVNKANMDLGRELNITTIPNIMRFGSEAEIAAETLKRIQEINSTVDIEKDPKFKSLESKPAEIMLDQSDFAPTKEGMIMLTSGFQEIDNQILRTEELFSYNAIALEESNNLVKGSTILLQRYNDSHADILLTQEETLKMLDQLNASLDSLSKKIVQTAQAEPQATQEVGYSWESALKEALPALEPKATNNTAIEEQVGAADIMKSAADTQVTSASTAAEAAAQDKLSTMSFFDSVKGFFNVGNMFQFAIDKLLGGLGGGSGEFNLFDTMLSLGIKSIAGGITGAFTNVATAFQYDTNIGSVQTGMIASQNAGLGLFANGGIMSQYGPLKLQKYATGGIAKDPQMAIFGEGDTNEAFVPLPDGRSIPVSMKGGGGMAIGDTNISIQVNVSSDGKQSTKVNSEGGAAFGKQLSASVRAVVQEEIYKQARPGGLFYGKV